MLFAETNQEATDLHIQAFRLAEELSLPVMVCMDGFVLTHATERIDVPTQEQVDAFLPPFEPRQVLDPADPVSIGAMVGPEAFTEVRYLAHAKQLQALGRIRELADEFAEAFGRRLRAASSAPTGPRTPTSSSWRSGRSSARSRTPSTSCASTARRSGSSGSPRSGRSRSTRSREAIGDARRVVVVERAFSVGFGGVLSTDVALAIADGKARVSTVVAGLGGRADHRKPLSPE